MTNVYRLTVVVPDKEELDDEQKEELKDNDGWETLIERTLENYCDIPIDSAKCEPL